MQGDNHIFVFKNYCALKCDIYINIFFIFYFEEKDVILRRRNRITRTLLACNKGNSRGGLFSIQASTELIPIAY